MVGWGLDASRSIPGGKDESRPGEAHLPLHPHNAALQAWLELGAPGAALMAVFLALLWRRLAIPTGRGFTPPPPREAWRRPSASAFAAYGIWQEWWLATLALSGLLRCWRSAARRTPAAALGGALAVVGVEQALAQADRFRRHLDQLVVGDIGDRLLQAS